jgi:ribosomal protein L37AE/L43A
MKKTNKAQKVTTTGCPACSHKKATVVSGRIYRCAGCEGIYGDCYLGDSYSHVLPYMAQEDVAAEQTRYFDFSCLGSAGLTRRHGWYDPSTKLIVQEG